jgi:hypothetical protein
MKKKLAALAGSVAVLASSFAFMGTPQASAMLNGGDQGGCPTTYGWIVVTTSSGSVWIPVLIAHCG